MEDNFKVKHEVMALLKKFVDRFQRERMMLPRVLDNWVDMAFAKLVNILEKRKINIACVQEARWVGYKARDVDRFKLWYSGRVGDMNGVSILLDNDLRELVVEVRRVNDRMMIIKLVVGGFTWHIISAYAPQAGLDEEVKRRFGEDLDEMVHTEKLLKGGDFNGHIGETSVGYDDVHGGFGFGDRNGGGMSLLDFARAFDLVIAN
ncbi:uncharacterized protein LOC142172499 [Nicotiana tabacum]|uniref:Uncharacterized protein LOC142172499 n=2 Tax=Nicotiana TaxID=4085 RepID=A0AC58T4S3_TOBAC